MIKRLIEETNKLKFEDFVKFSKTFMRRVRMEWLVIGNITEKEARGIVK